MVYVIDCQNGKQVTAFISKVNQQEIKLINKSKRFNFDWNKERAYDVYKLTALDVNEAIGLMALNKRPADYAIEIRLLAVSFDNTGKNKRYKRIAGCLVAFACKEAFNAGYGGYVCLKPKTELTNHYSSTYGFQSTGQFLIIDGKNSLELINEYL